MIEELPIEIISNVLKHFSSNELMSLAHQPLPAKVNEALHFRSLWSRKVLHIKNVADYKRCMSNLLRVQYCEKISFRDSQIHHNHMLTVLKSMKKVRCLSFEGFIDLDDHTLQVVLQQHGSELRVLDLTGCQYLTNYSISQIARKCRKLHTLILAECSFSSAALEIIAATENLVQTLRVLDASKCYLMDIGAIAPLSKLYRLQVLKLCGHEWLNSTNLPYVLGPLPHIQLVDIRNCEDFTKSGVDAVKRSLACQVEILENTKLADDSAESIRGYLMALIASQV